MTGPLAGVRVVEFAGLGPGPFAGMLLADMGADVVLIERPGLPAERADHHRGKRSIVLDLKAEADRAVAWQLIERADALIEGFRPGVMERLGLGPDAVAERNPRCIFGRITGWGQTGPLAHAAGHDINYVSLSGAMSIAGRPGEAPMLPATLVGDMGGGAMLLAFGIVCALFEARASGSGQTIDAAMTDGVALLATLIHQRRATGTWSDDPARNFFLGTSPFYDCFECADGKFVSFGAIEPAFYAELLVRLGLGDVDPARQYAVEDWPALRARVAAVVRTQPQSHWSAKLEGSDACFAPVLDFEAAAAHPHNLERGTYLQVAGRRQAAPAPRLSRTPGRVPAAGPLPNEHGAQILAELATASVGRG